MEEVKSGSVFLKQFILYTVIIIAFIVIIYGVRKVYLGVKQKQKWTKIIAVLLLILLVLLLIGGIGFYLYASALGEAFSTGL